MDEAEAAFPPNPPTCHICSLSIGDPSVFTLLHRREYACLDTRSPPYPVPQGGLPRHLFLHSVPISSFPSFPSGCDANVRRQRRSVLMGNSLSGAKTTGTLHLETGSGLPYAACWSPQVVCTSSRSLEYSVEDVESTTGLVSRCLTGCKFPHVHPSTSVYDKHPTKTQVRLQHHLRSIFPKLENSKFRRPSRVSSPSNYWII